MAQHIEDIDALVRDAEGDVDKEFAGEAKKQIAASFRRVRQAEKVLANARLEHDALIRDLKAGAKPSGPNVVTG